MHVLELQMKSIILRMGSTKCSSLSSVGVRGVLRPHQFP